MNKKFKEFAGVSDILIQEINPEDSNPINSFLIQTIDKNGNIKTTYSKINNP